MKPYLLFKNKLSPYWYAQIRLPDGTLTSNWKSLLNGKKIGEVTRDDINQIFYDKEVMKHASRSVRGIVNAIVHPMKYAYSHGLIDINYYDGLIKPAV